LMNLFNCEFTPGRAASAPNPKRAATPDGPAKDNVQAAYLTQLPHLMTMHEIEHNFPKVMPVNEDYGEEDKPIEEELGVPVPRLTRGPTRSTRTRPERAGENGRGEQRDRAHIVTGTGPTCDVHRPQRRGAAPVGRCLVGQPRCKVTERVWADWAAAGARHTAATADRTASTDDGNLATATVYRRYGHGRLCTDATATADCSCVYIRSYCQTRQGPPFQFLTS
jgi:hypothetical protein